MFSQFVQSVETFCGTSIYSTGLYIKAVILADFHKTVREEWTFVTEISSH